MCMVQTQLVFVSDILFCTTVILLIHLNSLKLPL